MSMRSIAPYQNIEERCSAELDTIFEVDLYSIWVAAMWAVSIQFRRARLISLASGRSRSRPRLQVFQQRKLRS